jgi:UDP-N-acetylglucosamine 4-epimerase
VSKEYKVVDLDNFVTCHRHNIAPSIKLENFSFIEGDIRNLDTCHQAVAGCHYVLYQAAMGSLPRSRKDPITSNEVNVGGFLNMLVACKVTDVKKMVYAASTSKYGDSAT